MKKGDFRQTQCITCGTMHGERKPCPYCNDSHVKRRRKARRQRMMQP